MTTHDSNVDTRVSNIGVTMGKESQSQNAVQTGARQAETAFDQADDVSPEHAEVERLRAHAADLLREKKALAKQAADMALELDQARTELAKLRTNLEDFHLRRPLVELAEKISPVPDLWLAEFQRHYRIEVADNELAIFTLDGKRLRHTADVRGSKGDKRGMLEADGEPVKFTQEDVWKALSTLRDGQQAKRWSILIRPSGVTGSGAIGSVGHRASISVPIPDATVVTGPVLGLR